MTRRAEFRSQHLEQAKRAYGRGELVLAGALVDPTDTAVLLFSKEKAAETFVETDPYVKNGLVKSWRVRKWNTVVGEGSSPP